MTDAPPHPISPEDYDTIHAAVVETARGRWFLAEHARRNRNADTAMLLEAIGRLEQSVRAAPPQPQPAAEPTADIPLRRDLIDMAEALARAKQEIAAGIAEARGTGGPEPARVFDDLLNTAEKADKDVFNAAEHVQEIAWALRETQDVARATADLDDQAIEIYRASNQHALTTQRIRAIVTALRFVETRMARLVESWAQDMAFVGEGPQQGVVPSPVRVDSLLGAPEGGSREDVMFAAPPLPPAPDSRREFRPREVHRREDLQKPAAPPPPAPRPVPAPPALVHPAPERRIAEADPRTRAFASIDALSPEQRLALFA